MYKRGDPPPEAGGFSAVLNIQNDAGFLHCSYIQSFARVNPNVSFQSKLRLDRRLFPFPFWLRVLNDGFLNDKNYFLILCVS